MSALCQKQTFRTAAETGAIARSRHSALRRRLALFDHLVSKLLQLWRQIEAERLRGLEVDHQLELGWQLDCYLGRFAAF
jgi:hypothetical protein